MKRFFAILLVAALLLCMLPAASVAAQYAKVVGGWLRLRSAANFNATTITSYYTGTEVEILGTSGGWYKVRTPDGRTGYMYGQYLKVGSSSSSGSSSVGNAYVTSHNGYGVRMRSGPGTGYRVIYTYDVGTPVTVLQSGNYWSKVSINGTVGYMMTQFLSYSSGSGSSSSDSVVCYATIWSRNGYGVRLRGGPGKDYGTIGTYSVGTTVAVLQKGSTWDKIRVGSRVGYMMNDFLNYHNTNEVTSVTLNNYSPAVGTVLSVQAISPSKATVSYEWRVNGTTKGTASTYTVTSADVGYQIQLKVTGIGSYTGSAKSAKTDAVLSNTALSGATLNTTAPVVGNTLSAAIEPSTATVLYAWIVGDSQVSNAPTYTVTANDVNKVIKLIVTGTGNYSGSKMLTTSAVTANGTLSGVSISNTTNTASGAVPAVGDVLKAVTSPSQATVTYQWLANDTAITGAASNTFTLTSDQIGKTISVKATAVAPYVGGTVTSTSTTAVINTPVAPVITTTELDGGKVGEDYSKTLQATGTTPITWSVVDGSLPAGLTLDASTGIISGKPTTAGKATFKVQAVNPAKQAATIELSIEIEASATQVGPKLVIAGPINITLKEGYEAKPINVKITNTGDAEATLTSLVVADSAFAVNENGSSRIASQQSDETWTITPPAGKAAGTEIKTTFTVSYDGVSVEADVIFTVEAAQVSGGSGSTDVPDTDKGSDDNDAKNTAVAPAITTADTATATAGVAFTLDLTATGSGTLTWEAANLPSGLQLNGSVISGTVAAADDYTFTVKVSSNDENLAEAERTASKQIKLTVTAGNENVQKDTYTVTVANGTGGGTFEKGALVKVTANSPETGMQFKEWKFTSETTAELNTATSSEATFTMPEGNVALTATYVEIPKYAVTVHNGTANGSSFAEGAKVTITAAKPENGKKFSGWKVISGGISLGASSEVTFDMPAVPVEVEAEYESLSKLGKPTGFSWNMDAEGKGSVSWDPVANASGYKWQRKYNDGLTDWFTTTATTIPFSVPAVKGTDEFTVIALGDGVNYLDSEACHSAYQ